MNIFVLDERVESAAEYHCDKHVVKMCLETAQILCTAMYELGFDEDIIPYRRTHKHHPCCKWATNPNNFLWLCQFGKALCEEYTYRYGKTHKCLEIITACEFMFKNKYPDAEPIVSSPFAQAMPDEYKSDNAVEAYRNYYINEKKDFAVWSKREKPFWFNID